MAKFKTEDEVRDADKIALGLTIQEQNIKQGTGQITTFNQLGFSGISRKPDGWYIPDNKNAVAIILETKNSDEDIKSEKYIKEIKDNFIQRHIVIQLYTVSFVLHIDKYAALILAKFHERSNVFLGRENGSVDIRLFHGGDLSDGRQVCRIIDHQDSSVRLCYTVYNAWSCSYEV